MRSTSQRRVLAFLVLLAFVAAACAQTNTLEVSQQTTDEELVAATPSGGDSDGVGDDSVVDGLTSDGSGESSVDPTGGSGPTTTIGSAEQTFEGPLKLGVLSTLSGGEKFVGEPPYRIALAYAERLNDRGGINGIDLEILGYDVCGNCPDEGLAQAKKAVEKDEVFALVNTFVVNASLDQVVPYLNDEGVPMVQGSSGALTRRPELTPYNFSVGLTVPNRAAIGADFAKKYLKEQGLPPKVALLYFTDSLTTYVAEEQRKALKRVGLEIVDEEPVTYDATMTNQSSQVIKMRAAGASMVIGSHGVLCAFNMQAADQANWSAPYLCTIMYDPFTATIAGHSALTDRDVFADTEGYATTDMKGSGMADYLELMDEYYPDGDVGLITMYSYLGMRMVEDGIRAMGNDVTQDGLVRYLEGLNGYDAGGLTAPFTLGPDDHGSITGGHIVQLNPDASFTRLTDDWVYPSAVHDLPGPVR
ncbi:ABC transporter substrate-binding protein [Actinospongicola halichondriae]|uniref:ABC transporter substrate-binding protein n=1 Tax=Actinospongicola halichondriae TaxID=3236844 RepID=UPI003D435498